MTLFDADLSIVNSIELAEHSFFPIDGPWGPPDRRPELLGMTVVQTEDQTSQFVAYSDSSHAYICEMSVPDLDVIQTRSLPDDWQGGQMLSLQWERENSLTSSLLLIDSRGTVLVFDAETLFQIGDGALPQPYVASLQTDFDGDGDPELITLARDRLTCYSIAPLAAPHDRFVLQPSSLILSEPYPNPFNAQTSIGYQVPEVAHVRIVLYDVTGREVKTMIEKVHQPGFYQLEVSGSRLNSGVYFCKMQSADFEQMVRLVYLK